MDVERVWEKALKRTEIIRSRIQPLDTFDATRIPYVFLSESPAGTSGTFVRKGHVLVEKPALVLPPNQPQLQGFEFDSPAEREAGRFMDFLLIRGVHFPSLKFNHMTDELSMHDGKLQAAIDDYQEQFQRQENVTAGLIAGPEEGWQFSILIFVAGQILRSADGDFRRLLEDYRRRENKGPASDSNR